MSCTVTSFANWTDEDLKVRIAEVEAQKKRDAEEAARSMEAGQGYTIHCRFGEWSEGLLKLELAARAARKMSIPEKLSVLRDRKADPYLRGAIIAAGRKGAR